MVEVIRTTGNYGEIYNRHLGPDSAVPIPRGLNNLSSQGGVLTAPLPMKLRRSTWFQLLLTIAVLTVVGILVNNLSVNLIRTGLGLSFRWLWRPAGFALGEHPAL